MSTDPTLVERGRQTLMERHHDEWSMETVSNAAHLAAEVTEQTGRGHRDVLHEIDRVISLFQHDSVRQSALDALRSALHADAETTGD